ncbi:hypothetical protein HELRODRAFT_194782 [Helobdella robusta]|uniref:SCA7 domain-containing protein n=1 Tax=Helobdella robusta TaxID=6412 RepID=T1FWE6_HELRO|nr:hypothetical protein HELRODRAFT_194782 [Helobdella robusta]ESN89883.1 hypothetical protein HELRODRAFT_194782 [Helobdella robusta]
MGHYKRPMKKHSKRSLDGKAATETSTNNEELTTVFPTMKNDMNGDGSIKNNVNANFNKCPRKEQTCLKPAVNEMNFKENKIIGEAIDNVDIVGHRPHHQHHHSASDKFKSNAFLIYSSSSSSSTCSSRQSSPIANKKFKNMHNNNNSNNNNDDDNSNSNSNKKVGSPISNTSLSGVNARINHKSKSTTAASKTSKTSTSAVVTSTSATVSSKFSNMSKRDLLLNAKKSMIKKGYKESFVKEVDSSPSPPTPSLPTNDDKQSEIYSSNAANAKQNTSRIFMSESGDSEDDDDGDVFNSSNCSQSFSQRSISSTSKAATTTTTNHNNKYKKYLIDSSSDSSISDSDLLSIVRSSANVKKCNSDGNTLNNEILTSSTRSTKFLTAPSSIGNKTIPTTSLATIYCISNTATKDNKLDKVPPSPASSTSSTVSKKRCRNDDSSLENRGKKFKPCSKTSAPTSSTTTANDSSTTFNQHQQSNSQSLSSRKNKMKIKPVQHQHHQLKLHNYPSPSSSSEPIDLLDSPLSRQVTILQQQQQPHFNKNYSFFGTTNNKLMVTTASPTLITYNPDIHCGVVGPNKLPCMQHLSCQVHHVTMKRLVGGRSKALDLLLLEQTSTPKNVLKNGKHNQQQHEHKQQQPEPMQQQHEHKQKQRNEPAADHHWPLTKGKHRAQKPSTVASITTTTSIRSVLSSSSSSSSSSSDVDDVSTTAQRSDARSSVASPTASSSSLIVTKVARQATRDMTVPVSSSSSLSSLKMSSSSPSPSASSSPMSSRSSSSSPLLKQNFNTKNSEDALSCLGPSSSGVVAVVTDAKTSAIPPPSTTTATTAAIKFTTRLKNNVPDMKSENGKNEDDDDDDDDVDYNNDNHVDDVADEEYVPGCVDIKCFSRAADSVQHEDGYDVDDVRMEEEVEEHHHHQLRQLQQQQAIKCTREELRSSLNIYKSNFIVRPGRFYKSATNPTDRHIPKRCKCVMFQEQNRLQLHDTKSCNAMSGTTRHTPYQSVSNKKLICKNSNRNINEHDVLCDVVPATNYPKPAAMNTFGAWTYKPATSVLVVDSSSSPSSSTFTCGFFSTSRKMENVRDAFGGLLLSLNSSGISKVTVNNKNSRDEISQARFTSSYLSKLRFNRNALNGRASSSLLLSALTPNPHFLTPPSSFSSLCGVLALSTIEHDDGNESEEDDNNDDDKEVIDSLSLHHINFRSSSSPSLLHHNAKSKKQSSHSSKLQKFCNDIERITTTTSSSTTTTSLTTASNMRRALTTTATAAIISISSLMKTEPPNLRKNTSSNDRHTDQMLSHHDEAHRSVSVTYSCRPISAFTAVTTPPPPTLYPQSPQQAPSCPFSSTTSSLSGFPSSITSPSTPLVNKLSSHNNDISDQAYKKTFIKQPQHQQLQDSHQQQPQLKIQHSKKLDEGAYRSISIHHAQQSTASSIHSPVVATTKTNRTPPTNTTQQLFMNGFAKNLPALTTSVDEHHQQQQHLQQQKYQQQQQQHFVNGFVPAPVASFAQHQIAGSTSIASTAVRTFNNSSVSRGLRDVPMNASMLNSLPITNHSQNNIHNNDQTNIDNKTAKSITNHVIGKLEHFPKDEHLRHLHCAEDWLMKQHSKLLQPLTSSSSFSPTFPQQLSNSPQKSKKAKISYPPHHHSYQQHQQQQIAHSSNRKNLNHSSTSAAVTNTTLQQQYHPHNIDNIIGLFTPSSSTTKSSSTIQQHSPFLSHLTSHPLSVFSQLSPNKAFNTTASHLTSTSSLTAITHIHEQQQHQQQKPFQPQFYNTFR